jgi:heme exporter protein A
VKPLLSFDAVTLRRGGRLLFEGLDLALGPGEALQVAGPNGSGKSSLIRLAAGLLRAESGVVERTDLALAGEHVALDRELPLALLEPVGRPGLARARASS